MVPASATSCCEIMVKFIIRCQQTFLLLLCWQAPLGVRSAKRRHRSPEWTILSHLDCFIQGEVAGFQVLLDSLHHGNSTYGSGLA